MEIGRAAREVEVADVPHERDVGVVDRDGQLRLVVERARARLLRRRAHDRREREVMSQDKRAESDEEGGDTKSERLCGCHEKQLLSLRTERFRNLAAGPEPRWRRRLSC